MTIKKDCKKIVKRLLKNRVKKQSVKMKHSNKKETFDVTGIKSREELIQSIFSGNRYKVMTRSSKKMAFFDTFDFLLLQSSCLLSYSNKQYSLTKYKQSISGNVIFTELIEPEKSAGSIGIKQNSGDEGKYLIDRSFDVKLTDQDFIKYLHEITVNRKLIRQSDIYQKSVYYQPIGILEPVKLSIVDYYLGDSENGVIFKTYVTITAADNKVDEYRQLIKKYVELNICVVDGKRTGNKQCNKQGNKQGNFVESLMKTGFIFDRLNVINHKVCVLPDEPILIIYRRILLSCLNIISINIDGIKDDIDIEFLHDFRVAIRRLRSLNELCEGVESESLLGMINPELKRICKITNKLRDIDVYLEKKEKYKEGLPLQYRVAVDCFFDDLSAKRANEHKKVRESLVSLENSINKWLSILQENGQELKSGRDSLKDTLQFARESIYKKFSELCEKKKYLDEDSDDAEYHSIRIICKKLRYLIDFFSPVFSSSDISIFQGGLKKLQNLLGLFNDNSIQILKFGKYLNLHMHLNGKENVVIALGYIIVNLTKQQAELKFNILDELNKFTYNDIWVKSVDNVL